MSKVDFEKPEAYINTILGVAWPVSRINNNLNQVAKQTENNLEPFFMGGEVSVSDKQPKGGDIHDT